MAGKTGTIELQQKNFIQNFEVGYVNVLSIMAPVLSMVSEAISFHNLNPSSFRSTTPGSLASLTASLSLLIGFYYSFAHVQKICMTFSHLILILSWLPTSHKLSYMISFGALLLVHMSIVISFTPNFLDMFLNFPLS